MMPGKEAKTDEAKRQNRNYYRSELGNRQGHSHALCKGRANVVAAARRKEKLDEIAGQAEKQGREEL